MLRGILADLSKRYRDTPMAGRTHLQQALPVTFGYKTSIWLAMFDRHADRLEQLKPRVLVGQFAGAAGTLASLGIKGFEVQQALCEELGLGVPVSTWHVARDGFAEAVNFLALVTGSLGKIALDIMIMASTEFAEVYEPFVKGRGASSTMPQKRNPISSELMLAAAKAVRQHAGLMLDAQIQDFERATGPWHAEWIAIPESFVLTAGALHQAKFALGGLIVDEAQMAKNLDISRGLIVAEAVMMGLAPQLGRQEAHDVVYDACRRANEQHISLGDALLGRSAGYLTDRSCDDRAADLAGQLPRPCPADGRPRAGLEAALSSHSRPAHSRAGIHAAIDDELGAGDVARCIGGEIQHAVGDVACLAGIAERRRQFRALLRIDRRIAHVAGRSGRDLAPDRRVDDAGMHGVDADAVAGTPRIPSRSTWRTAARRPWSRNSRRAPARREGPRATTS